MMIRALSVALVIVGAVTVAVAQPAASPEMFQNALGALQGQRNRAMDEAANAEAALAQAQKSIEQLQKQITDLQAKLPKDDPPKPN